MGVVYQPTTAPSNKLAASTITVGIMEFFRPPILAVLDILSTVDVVAFGQTIPLFAGLASDGFSAAVFAGLQVLAGYAAGYLIRDHPNVVAMLPPEPPPTT